MKEKTLYVHIGMHKTATTTIQHFCKENTDLLSSKNYAYPIFPFSFPNKPKERNGAFLFTKYFDSKGERHEDIELEYYARGIEIVHDLFKEHDNVIVSDERLWINFYNKGARVLVRLLKDSREHGYQVKIIAYLRRQDKLIESWWNQRIKVHAYMTYDLAGAIKEYHYLDYYTMLSKFAELAGRENLIVRRFEEAVKNSGIIQDFLGIFGLELTDEYQMTEIDSNPGLRGNVSEIKRIINGLEDFNKQDNYLFRESLLNSSAVSGKNYPCSEFSDEERAAFMTQFKEGNESVVRDFIGDGQPLFSENYTGAPKRQKDNPYFIDDVIRSSAATDIVLYRQILDLAAKKDEEILELKETIREMSRNMRQMSREMKQMQKTLDKHETRIHNLRYPMQALKNKLTNDK